MHQRISELLSSRIVDSLHGGSRNIHLFCAHLLGEVFKIDQPDRLIFIYSHVDGLPFFYCGPQGAEAVVVWEATYVPPFSWSWHICSLYWLSTYVDYMDIVELLLAYVNNMRRKNLGILQFQQNEATLALPRWLCGKN